MPVLLHPSYAPNITQFAILAQREVYWEVQDNFQKQTFRNRTYICTDQGRHMMNIPIRHAGGEQGRQLYKAVKTDTDTPWQRTHWRTLETAYRTSPFFEYYEDELAPLFLEDTATDLLEFNLQLTERLCDCLQLPFPKNRTENYKTELDGIIDARWTVNAKDKRSYSLPHYVQVFGDRHGFIENLSVLDLLFNEGTNALSYLENTDLSFLE
ncbi:WbqC family protein [Sediminicola luteus]|uniref:WbqC family protein n=1 Tax=Sediminicola luteus TaxID=319238 RepID=A0A2A4GAQ5_9FLAO|nr:WbqC family protein [Sediminicola luteus]PCE64832.1 hypothetical protein B7P33_06595 [Sediminicola luteus]